MTKTFDDFSALKGLKKELEAQQPAVPSKAQQPVARSKTVKHPTREEERAKKEGIEKGMRVRLMDSNDEGTVTAIGKDAYVVEIDGLPMKLIRSEFIPVNKDNDRKLYAAMPSRHKRMPRTKEEPFTGNLVVDLHIERLPGGDSVPEWAVLDYQVEHFKRVLRGNLRHRGRRIVFIHGDGDGTLKKAIRKELDEAFALSCSYSPAPSEDYGTGATTVTIR